MESLARAWYVDELGELGKGREEDRMGERGHKYKDEVMI